MLPDSDHQLLETYGLFIDDQNTLVYQGEARSWGALGGSLAVYGSDDTPSHPQFVLYASTNAAMHFNDNWRIWTETLDVHLGGNFEFALSPSLRLLVGLEHFSGHAVDGISTPSLMVPNLGNNIFKARIVYDYKNSVRMGATFRPFIASFPPIQFFAADQFVEYFPWGGKDSTDTFSPYVAVALEEYGVSQIQPTFEGQIGAYLGNHFGLGHHPTARVVLGYYNGADPRLKYFQIAQVNSEFAYAGLMFDM